jgi:hypothetical protein
MTDDELRAMAPGQPVTVTGGDYSYAGWLNVVFEKRSGAVRCVVEDENGRLFVHNAKQLDVRLADAAKL